MGARAAIELRDRRRLAESVVPAPAAALSAAGRAANAEVWKSGPRDIPASTVAGAGSGTRRAGRCAVLVRTAIWPTQSPDGVQVTSVARFGAFPCRPRLHMQSQGPRASTNARQNLRSR